MRSWCLMVVVVLTWPAWADVIELTDGTKLEGRLQRTSDGWTVTDKTGKSTHVADSRVAGISKTGTHDPKAIAESHLNALHRMVDRLEDLEQIIGHYARFLAEHKNTPAAATAQKELELWKDRQAKGMRKVNGVWMTREQQLELVGRMVPMIQEARALVREGRYHDAEVVVNKILEIDAGNVSGLYLRGVVAYKLGQIGQAKKWFSEVREAMPNHGPTLNNLAVIAWYQQQPAMAIALYDQAMLAAPRTQRILDNTAEALDALPVKLKASTAAVKALQRFREQDAVLQKELEAEGLSRWGARYLTKEQMGEVKRLQSRLDLLAQDYEKTKSRIEAIDRQIEANERTMERIRADRTFVDPTTGRLYQHPKPSIYYQLRRENTRMRDERASLIDELSRYEERRVDVFRTSPIQPFTRVQRIIEAEGTPLALPQPSDLDKPVPATQPSAGTI